MASSESTLLKRLYRLDFFCFLCFEPFKSILLWFDRNQNYLCILTYLTIETFNKNIFSYNIIDFYIFVAFLKIFSSRQNISDAQYLLIQILWAELPDFAGYSPFWAEIKDLLSSADVEIRQFGRYGGIFQKNLVALHLKAKETQ